MNCPRCIRGQIVGDSCLQCGHEGSGPSFTERLALMAEVPAGRAAPRLPDPTRTERYEERVNQGSQAIIATFARKREKKVLEDEVLFQAAARRVGAGVDDLRSSAKAYSALRREVATELGMLGLSYERIGGLLGRSASTIQGWFRGS